MITFNKPSYDQLKDYLWQHTEVPFTYDEVEGTRGASPEGYSCGHVRVKLGTGRECYLAAKQSLDEWKMFPEDFVDLIWPVPLEAGRVVATLFRAPVLWTTNPCRIVYTFDEIIRSLDSNDEIERYGFAYGTVGRHLASGEEKFSVEYDHGDETVWYEIYCFSRVNHWLSALAYPYFRSQQHRFRTKSAIAMQQAVAQPAPAFAVAG